MLLLQHRAARWCRAFLVAAVSMLAFFPASAQDNISPENLKLLQQAEDSMSATIDSMYMTQIPDERSVYAQQFARQLVQALKVPNSYSYAFPKVADKINVIAPPDNSFRIFNWVIAPSDVTRRYYGAIQMPGESLKLHGLVDCSLEVSKGLEDSVFKAGRWFGALYYRIMPVETSGQKYYVLFGLNAGGLISTKKVLDPLMITPNGPVFGAQIFGMNSQTARGQRINRFVMEYKKDVQASLNWNDERKAIFFDKLVSEVNDPNRKYTFVPSGQYDGFRWDGNMFAYIQDLIPITLLKDGEMPIGDKE